MLKKHATYLLLTQQLLVRLTNYNYLNNKGRHERPLLFLRYAAANNSL